MGTSSRAGHPPPPLRSPLTREEVEAALAEASPGWGDSLDHPAYAENAIINTLATRPEDDAGEAGPEQDRR